MSPCPTLDRLEAFASGRCDPREGEALSAHIGSCPTCQESLRDVRLNLGVLDTVRSVLSDSGSGRIPAPSPLGLVGRSFDGYTTTRVLGSGASSTVYEARQESVGRMVAIKVLSTLVLSPDHIKRFEHEARILAQLRHPGIAQVFGSGVIPDDAGARPYIAMELVDGESITRHADDRDLAVNARLALLAEACEAIDHAHSRGVVHRDLKPANVLVTHAGSVRIVDFGFARATEGQSVLSTMHTAHGQIVGTVGYMSPEHVAGASEVGVRSDVYSLGVIAYELLTHRPPIGIKDTSLEVALRKIIEQEPTRLSTLDPSLAGDIETVVLRALEKRPQDRYPSAGALGADLRRIIAGDPVGVKPPGPVSRAAKFARRHRALVTGAGAVLVALLLGLAGTTYGLVRALERTRVAEDRRKNAEQLAALLEQMLREAHPHEAKGRNYTVRQMLDDFSRRFTGGLEGQPLVEAALRTTMGTGYRVLGEYALARPHLERALALRTGADPPSPLTTAGAMCDLAQLDHDEGTYAKAIERFRQAADLADAGTEVYARAMLGWADCLHHQGDMSAARAQGRAALDAAEHVGAGAPGSSVPDPLTVAEAHIMLSRIERDAGDLETAQTELDQGMTLLRSGVNTDDPRLADALNDVAWLALMRRDSALAEKTAREALDVGSRTLGPNHPDIANSKYELALILATRGDNTGAESLIREAIETYRTANGDVHPSTFTAKEALARILRAQGKPQESLEILQSVLEGRKAFFGERNLEVGYALSGIGETQRDLKDLDGAEKSLSEATDIYKEAYKAAHPFIAKNLISLSQVAEDRGDRARAESLLLEAIAQYESTVGPDHADTLFGIILCGQNEEAMAQWDQALARYDTVLARCTPTTHPMRPVLAHQGRGRCLVAQGKTEEGLAELRAAVLAVEAIVPKSAKRIAAAREDLAGALEKSGDIAGAAAARAGEPIGPGPVTQDQVKASSGG